MMDDPVMWGAVHLLASRLPRIGRMDGREVASVLAGMLTQ
jgi:hypothetical protein